MLLRVLNAVKHAWVKSVNEANWAANYGVGLENSGYSATSDFFAWQRAGNTSWTWDKSYKSGGGSAAWSCADNSGSSLFGLRSKATCVILFQLANGIGYSILV